MFVMFPRLCQKLRLR